MIPASVTWLIRLEGSESMPTTDKQLNQLLNEIKQVEQLLNEDRPSLRADTIVELIKKTRPDKDE